MAEIITVARPYAEAVFRLASESKSLPAWSQFLTVLAQVADHAEVKTLLESPSVSRQDLLSVFESALGKTPNAEVSNLLKALADNHRLSLLPEMQRQYEVLRAQAEKTVDALVETAFPLTDAQTKELSAGLEKRFQRNIRLTVQQAPSLIGGVRITVGDDIIDASVSGKLQAMAYRLKS